MSRRSLALADDHELVVRGLASLLSPHHDIRGIVHSAAELITFLEHESVECVLLDLSMPERNGLEVIQDLRRRWPALKIIIVTMHVDRALADTALSLGANGFVPKDADLDDLLAAVENVFAGKRYLSPRIARHTLRSGPAAPHLSLADLTPRQQEILLLLSEGKSSAAIAKVVGLSESTVTFHRGRIRHKLGIDSEWGLYQYGLLMRQALAEPKEAPATSGIGNAPI